ncbi:uncharacterized protein LOC123301459 isoform X2 [Chrysoperla carnea]|uniref:uncharacterized protein LOC123301459 isoform X2 n=1 Tax=Chrysoperla carnea TaxID=189513 RepID=UPI001D05E40E|nr:uncharacterized protein LOC123301459 isoform X2 [Chrysoperla carnea]
MDSMEVSLDEQAMELDSHQARSGEKSGGSRSSNRGIGIIQRLPKGIGCNSTKLHFSKTFLMYSYGYAWPYFTVDSNSYQATSLALIPVDFLPSYLSKTEFDHLPAGSRMTESNVKYGLDAANPMVPTSATKMDGTVLYDKMYKGTALMILGIPRSISDYWALVRSTTADKNNPNTGGHPRLDKLINRFMVTNTADTNLCTYHYKCKNAILKSQKKT